MRNAITFFFAVAMLAANCQTSVPGGFISGTWNAVGSPYNIQGSIMVPADSTLIIQAGVTINFTGHYKFVVNGRLLALGTPSDPVVFTASNASTGWYGLRFDHNSIAMDSTIIDHCTFQYARATEPEPNGGAMQIASFSKMRVSNCLFKNNYANYCGGAIDINYCSPLIINNTFDGNSVDYQSNMLNGGGAIFCSSCNSLISGNTFTGNTCGSGPGGGAAFFNWGGSPVVSRNLFTGNVNTNNTIFGEGGGGAIFCDGDATIIGNTITNNMATGNIGRGGGIYFYWNDNSMLINNLIVNNSATGNEGDGGGLYLLDENTPAVINNTIANNHAITDGGALYCRWTSKPVFINSILSGNTAGNDTNQVFLYDEASDPDFLYCDIQGGQADFSLNGNFYFGDYENNISADPCFPWPTAGSGSAFNGLVADWTEGPASPCINAGNPEGYYPATDLAGKPRVVGTFIDIGAFEYQWPVGTPPDRIRCEVSVTPNPCTDATTLHFPFRVDHGKLLVYNAIGDIAAVFDNVNGDSYRLDCNGFTSGVYYFELRSEGRKIARGRLVVAG